MSRRRKERRKELIASFTPTEVCPCIKTGCERHSDHDACRTYHYRKGSLPRCIRDKGK